MHVNYTHSGRECVRAGCTKHASWYSFPHAIGPHLDDAGVPAVAGDLVFARASVVDERFRPVPVTGQSIRFEASGDFEIVGDQVTPLEAGTASVLVRIKSTAAKGSIKASGDRLAGSLDVPF